VNARGWGIAFSVAIYIVCGLILRALLARSELIVKMLNRHWYLFGTGLNAMNLRRIALFSLALLFVQTLTSATVTYLVSKQLGGHHEQVGLWIVVINHLVDFAVIVPLFIWLGRNQRSRPYLHAAIALALSELAAFAILSSLLGSVAIQASHAIGMLTLSAYAVMGTTIGLRMKGSPLRRPCQQG
jgi:Kef-type K+ transport system membrane component KefB